METHFTSFTLEAMRSLVQEMAEESQRRREFIETTRSHTRAMLASVRQERREAEAQRRQNAAHAVDARRLFTSELRSGVHALRNRFELDFRQMAGELRAAREAFRNRPARHHGPSLRRAARPAAQQHKPAEHTAKPRHEDHEGGRSTHAEKAEPTKRHHG
jgi:hypothetical protein